jgi:hypothetical protein
MIRADNKQTDATAVLEAKGRQLSFSHVRLLPKEKGVRPVVNLSRKPVRPLSRQLEPTLTLYSVQAPKVPHFFVR